MPLYSGNLIIFNGKNILAEHWNDFIILGLLLGRLAFLICLQSLLTKTKRVLAASLGSSLILEGNQICFELHLFVKC